MAIYHFHLKKVSKSKGINGKALKHAKYILREDEYENKGREHEEYILREGSFDKKNDLEYKEHGNMPEFIKEQPKNFWKTAEKNERKNGVIYREFEIALPVEFSREQNIDLVKEFVERELGKDYIYTFAIHKPKSLTKEGMDQPHVHLMFCDRKLDGIERNEKDFFKRYNSKNPELGGARKEIEWQTKEKLVDLRKDWEILLNSHLEKNNINQKISCETLSKQREKFLEEGNKIEADRLNREVINIDGRILYKKEKDLTDYEKKLKEDFFEKIKMKEIKENIYNIEKTQKRNSQEDKNESYEEKSIFELEKDKKELIKQIEKLKVNSAYENLKKTAINQLTSRKLYNLLNENKKTDKEIRNLREKIKFEEDHNQREELNKLLKNLSIKKDKILNEYNSILLSYDTDSLKKSQLIRKMESIGKSYKNKELIKRETLSKIDRIITEKKELAGSKHKNSNLDKLLKVYKDKSFKEIYEEKEEIKKKILKLNIEGEIKNIERVILDEITDNEYSLLLAESVKLNADTDKLEAEFESISALKFMAKEAKRKEFNKSVNKYNRCKEKIKKIKDDYGNTKDFKIKIETLKKMNSEKLEMEREKLKNLEIIENLRSKEKKVKPPKIRGKDNDENNIGVSFFMKKRHEEKEEEMEEEFER